MQLQQQQQQQYFAEEDSKPVPDAFALLPVAEIPFYTPLQRIHHVVLHLPAGAPETVEALNAYVDSWLNRQNLNKLRRALAIPDPSHPYGFTWPERGWSSDDVFDPQIKASLKKYKTCIVARKINFDDAIRLQRRLSNSKCAFITSAIALPLEMGNINTVLPVCQRDPTHRIRATNITETSTGIKCPLCDCECLNETAYTCDSCLQVQSCSLCLGLSRQNETEVFCRIFAGHGLGTRIRYPPQDAAIVARAAVVAARGQDPEVRDAQQLAELQRLLALEGGGASSNVSDSSDSDSGSGKENPKRTHTPYPPVPPVTDAVIFTSGGGATTSSSSTSLSTSSTSTSLSTSLSTSSGGGGSHGSTSATSSSSSSSSSGGRSSREMLISRFMPNRKPKTKKTVLESLPKAVYCIEKYENQTDCIMCQSPFCEDDSIVILPCKHIFHGEGSKNEESIDCPLLTDWLKMNNGCPICRDKLPAEEISDKWICPLCAKELSGLKCIDCNLESRHAFLAEEAGFEQIEALYLDITEFRLSSQSGGFEDARYAIFLSKIDELMESTFINALVGANWDIAIGTRMVLEQNLNGEFELDNCIVGIDNGSATLLRILIKRLMTKNMERFPSDLKPKPIKPPARMADGWTCSLCACSSNREGDASCTNCEASVRSYKQTLAVHCQEVYSRFVSLALRGIEITIRVNNGTISEREKLDLRSQLKRDITMFLDSRAFMEPFENAGYLIKRHLKAFFNRILLYKTNFPFVAESYIDINSVASYANFINELRKAIGGNSTLRVAAITVERPNAESIQRGEPFESVADHRYPAPTSAVTSFLESNREHIMHLCRHLAFGSTFLMWSQIEIVIGRIDSEYPIKSAVTALRGGCRDLPTLVEGLAPASKFIVEAILKKVMILELQRSFFEVDDIISFGSPRAKSNSLADLVCKAGGGALLERQNSIGTDTKSALRSLKDATSPEDFTKILFFFFKVVRNINGEPNKLEFRRISKEVSFFKKYVSPYPAALSVIHFIGFVDSPVDSGRLYLRDLNQDLIARCQLAISDIASEFNVVLPTD